MSTLEKTIAVARGGLKFSRYGAKRMPRLRGKCRIHNKGRLRIGNNFSLIGNQIPVYLSTENKQSELIIGDNVAINYGVDIGCTSKIMIGNHVKIAPLTNIIDYNYHQIDDLDDSSPVPIIISNNVWIARGCTILRGVKIGENAVIAAGSVVTKNVEKNTMVGGSPARLIRNLKITNGWIRQ